MLYPETANFILPAGAYFLLALDVSALSFSVSFVEVLECFINMDSMK